MEFKGAIESDFRVADEVMLSALLLDALREMETAMEEPSMVYVFPLIMMEEDDCLLLKLIMAE